MHPSNFGAGVKDQDEVAGDAVGRHFAGKGHENYSCAARRPFVYSNVMISPECTPVSDGVDVCGHRTRYIVPPRVNTGPRSIAACGKTDIGR